MKKVKITIPEEDSIKRYYEEKKRAEKEGYGPSNPDYGTFEERWDYNERPENPHDDNIERLEDEIRKAPNSMSRRFYQKELEAEVIKRDKYQKYLDKGKKPETERELRLGK